MLKKYFMHRRGGLTCPPERVVLAQTKSYTTQFMGTKTKWRTAVAVVRNGTLGRTYESAPTFFINSMARGEWSRADTTRSGGLRKLMAQAVEMVKNGTLGRTYESAPTFFINSMARGGWDSASGWFA